MVNLQDMILKIWTKADFEAIMKMREKTKEVWKIIGFVLLMVLMVVGIFLYYPIIFPIVIFVFFYEREKRSGQKKSSPPPTENDVENFETIDE